MSADRESNSNSSEFEQRARTLLLQSADELPGAVRSRLTQARYAALAARRPRLSHQAWRWAPAGAAAAAVLALLIVFVPHAGAPPINAMSMASAEDIALLTDSDAMPLSGDQDVDYDFYEWASGEAEGTAAPSSVGT